MSCFIFFSMHFPSLSPSGTWLLAAKAAVKLDNAQFVGCSHGWLRTQQDWVTAEAHSGLMRSTATLQWCKSNSPQNTWSFPSAAVPSAFYSPIKDSLFFLQAKSTFCLNKSPADACVSSHSSLLSSFPSHLSHSSCNRLSPFAVAPAFMEYVPQGVRVIVLCLS